ncbi:MAG: FkbM family methyltransferase [Gallionellaceae bacterium]
MIDFHNVIYKMPNYVRRFGLIHGLRLLLLIERRLGRDATCTDAIRVPGYPFPIHLRDTISDHATFWQCIVDNQYDFCRFPQAERLNEEYKRMTGNGETPLIIDCGANVGLATLWLAYKFPLARIVAVEPDTDNFNALLANIRPLGNRIRALQGGIWNRGGHLDITNPGAGSAAYRVAYVDQPTQNSIRAYTIADICQMEGVTAPFIAKLDIEGAQLAVFSDNTDWVSGTHLIMIELDDWQMPWVGTSRPFFSTLSRVPFDYLIHGESIFCFRDFKV